MIEMKVNNLHWYKKIAVLRVINGWNQNSKQKLYTSFPTFVTSSGEVTNVGGYGLLFL